MNPFKRIFHATSGARKAYADISLAEAFLAEHDNKPPADIAARFFRSLDGDRAGTFKSSVEERAYRVTVAKFQKHVIRQVGYTFGADEGMPDVQSLRITLSPDSTPESIREELMQKFGSEEVADAIVGMLIGRLDEFREANLEAGKCLGCGGEITPDGDCAEEPIPTAAEKLKANIGNMTIAEKRAHMVSLEARIDQLKTSARVGSLSDAEERELEAVVDEINVLAIDAGSDPIPPKEEQ